MNGVEMVRHHLAKEYIYRPVREVVEFIELFNEAMDKRHKRSSLAYLTKEYFGISHYNYSRMITGLVNALVSEYSEIKANELFESKMN